MHVVRLTTRDQLAALRADWNRLADGVVFRRWEWLANWWLHHERDRQLFVLTAANDDGKIVGIAPWFIETQPGVGRVIRVLGSIRASIDYVGLLAAADDQRPVAEAFAQWLLEHGSDGAGDDGWDLMDLEGLQTADPGIEHFATWMADAKQVIHRRNGENCWVLELSPTWDEYLARLSKPVRRRVRDVTKQLDGGDEYRVELAVNREQITTLWPTLVDLHQRRRASLGQAGCFSNDDFSRFLLSAVSELAETQQAEIVCVSRGEKTLALELCLVSGTAYQVFQVGIDPDALDDNPGWLVNVAAMRRAWERGCRTFDLLRGDERYKAQLRAEPLATFDLRIVPNRLLPQMRHGMWVTQNAVKEVIKSGFRKAGIL